MIMTQNQSQMLIRILNELDLLNETKSIEDGQYFCIRMCLIFKMLHPLSKPNRKPERGRSFFLHRKLNFRFRWHRILRFDA